MCRHLLGVVHILQLSLQILHAVRSIYNYYGWDCYLSTRLSMLEAVKCFCTVNIETFATVEPLQVRKVLFVSYM